MTACRFECYFSKINARVIGAVSREHHRVRSVTRADFQDSLASRFSKWDQQWNMPFRAIALFAEFIIKFPLVREPGHKMSAARFGAPKRAYFFQCSALCHDLRSADQR